MSRLLLIAALLVSLPADARPRKAAPKSTTFDVRLTGYVERSMVMVITDEGAVEMRGSGGCYDTAVREVDGVTMHEITPC